MTTAAPPDGRDVRPAGSVRAGGVRTDIQGLRAIAVGIVVAYHLAPGPLPGGFAGVDVFFVISGFLITTHLLVRPPGTGRDLLGFWSRRIRRLLPASLLVLAATLVASRLVAPETQWADTARQARAAALYGVNWLLAGDSVDYLASENVPTPVQHFWSLSVEEQFYLLWPILILLLVLIARRTRISTRTSVGVGLTVVVAASFAYSVTETASNPAAAYFVTPTRIWELGAGGLLALATSARVLGREDRVRVPPPLVAAVMAWAGLGAIVATALLYSGGTPFPGYQAALPVLGAALVIAGNPGTDRRSPGPLLALRPVQWLGDVSYSVYLWHWPLVVLVPFVSGGSIGLLDGAVIVVVTLVLSGLTKTFVEDRFRDPSWGRPLAKPYVLGAVGMALVVALSVLQLVEVDHREDRARAELRSALSGGSPCFGAGALDPGRTCKTVSYDDLLPAPVDAANDNSDAYPGKARELGCFAYLPSYRSLPCTFGDRDAKRTVALVGNSHAGQWLPALQALAKRYDWRIRTYMSSQCASADVAQRFDTTAQSEACTDWARRTTRQVARDRPDAVVMSNRISIPVVGKAYEDSFPSYGAGYAKVLAAWKQAGLDVLVLHDTPAPGFQVPQCLAAHPQDLSACDGTRKDWINPEPAKQAVAAQDDPRIRLVDLNRHVCATSVCRAVNGGVVTYFDGSHLSATYSTTLAPYLGPPLRSLLAR